MYIDVILPVPLANFYTYSVPPEWEERIVPGMQVLVEFGKNKRYSGLVLAIRELPPDSEGEVKPVLKVESESPVVRDVQLRFWEWLSAYYLCTLGEVFKSVFPSGLRSDTATNYSPKQEIFIGLASEYQSEESRQAVLDRLKKSSKQVAFLSSFFGLMSDTSFDVEKHLLMSQPECSPAALSALLAKKILLPVKKARSRLLAYQQDIKPLNLLNTSQSQALSEIRSSFQEKEVSLLYGVTSSGKTEIYMHLIRETLKAGQQVLYLLPEIALTTHLTERLSAFLGDKLVVYHSKVNDNKRIEIWNDLLRDSSSVRIVVGARSAVFLPFQNLGLVVVDEEHESGYKQQDPAPRYHARNAAMVLARMHGAKTLLGSATPSLESYYNAQTGKYGFIRLDKRFEDVEMPGVECVDVKELRRKKRMKGLFSPILTEKIEACLEREEQILLFHNRRGFSPVMTCRICDWTPKCAYCDVSLAYHKQNRMLSCHYCGRTYRIPKCCPECESEELSPVGYGTEKVEEEIRRIFPDASVARLDSDTTKSKKAMEDVLTSFGQGKIQILIGTQMVSKGLDFSNLTLAAVLNADFLMNYPEFRAHEKAFQLMMQVAGRTGRRSKKGEVIIQTSHPDHPLIRTILCHDYEGMYELQSGERQLFKYPPFYRLIEINLKGKKEETVKSAAQTFAAYLENKLGDRVIGPDKPVVGKIQNFYLRRILLKIELNVSLQNLHEIIKTAQLSLLSHPEFKYLIIQYNVDPL